MRLSLSGPLAMLALLGTSSFAAGFSTSSSFLQASVSSDDELPPLADLKGAYIVSSA